MTKKRKGTSKKVRFEVFKRDSFTCQYCGKAAPDVVLECDHISPVSKGGGNDILNLVTSCRDCNAGKSDRELSDDSTIQKQKAQLTELNERREQLEMMLKWREGIKLLQADEIDSACEYWADLTGRSFTLNENGKRRIKPLIKKYGLNAVLTAMDSAAESYLKYEDDALTQASVENAISKLNGICYTNTQPDYMRDLFYIRGIVRKRMHCVDWRALQLLKAAYNEGRGADIDSLRDIAKSAYNWTEWQHDMECIVESMEADLNG